MPFQCRTCGKVVKEKHGKLSCCGITETVAKSNQANHEHQAASRVFLKGISRKLFTEPVTAHWNEDSEEFDDYEGIPNSD